jgi:single-strand DNA-binding protein
MNIVVVRGLVSRGPDARALSTGERLVSIELKARRDPDRPAEPVPITWLEGVPVAPALGEGDEVVVVGRVRTRFFRSARGTESRTEVVADRVARTRQRRAVTACLDEARALLEET